MWTKTASLLMFLAVLLGAFGAHALRQRLDAYSLDIYKTAVWYQMIHAIGIFVVAWFASLPSVDPKAHWAGWAFTIGILLFSGSLYGIALTGIKPLGAIAPFGGLLFMTGWGLLFLCRSK